MGRGMIYGNVYRYGFQGQEKDDEIKGAGNSYDFGARMYDSRLGRWLKRDGLERKKPNLSPYQSHKLNPIIYNDPDGNDEFLVIVINDQKTGKTTTIKKNNAISTKIMCDGNKDKSGFFANYFDYEKVVTYTIDNVGITSVKESYKILYSNGIKDRDLTTRSQNSLEGEIKNGPTGMLWEKGKEFEGQGGTQNGGYALTTSEGGVSETKQVAKDTPGMINIEVLLNALPGIGKSITPSQLNPNKFGELMLETADKITGLISVVDEVTSGGDLEFENQYFYLGDATYKYQPNGGLNDGQSQWMIKTSPCSTNTLISSCFAKISDSEVPVEVKSMQKQQ